MSIENAFLYVSIGYLILLTFSAVAAVYVRWLNNQQELGTQNRATRWLATKTVITLTIVSAFASVVLFFLSQAINKKSEAKVADANRLANEAGKTAGEANERAGKLEKEARFAEKRTAELNFQIEKMRAPRTLSVQQLNNLKTICSQFVATPFDMAVTEGDPEAQSLQTVIETLLLESGWSQHDWGGYGFHAFHQGRAQFGYMTTSKVSVFLHEDSRAKIAPAAEAFAKALHSAGIDVEYGIENWNKDGANGSPLDINNIHVVIGRKAM